MNITHLGQWIDLDFIELLYGTVLIGGDITNEGLDRNFYKVINSNPPVVENKKITYIYVNKRGKDWDNSWKICDRDIIDGEI